MKTAFIDLDGCLIPSKFSREVPKLIARYAVTYLGYDPSSALVRCKEEYKKHGTNLEAFVVQGLDIDPDHYNSHIHRTLPYHTLRKDLELRSSLSKVPARKFVFTNADITHAKRCLERTGLSSCFEDVIGYETLRDVYAGIGTPCKPKDAAMILAMNHAGILYPQDAVLFDDASRNVFMAKRCGAEGVMVNDREALPSVLKNYFLEV